MAFKPDHRITIKINDAVTGSLCEYSALAGCPACGETTYARMKARNETSIEMQFRRDCPLCPLCGKKLFANKAYYCINFGYKEPTGYDYSRVLNKIELEEEREKRKLWDSVLNKRITVNPSPNKSLDDLTAIKIRSDPDLLKSYLKNLIDLELDSLLLVKISAELAWIGKAAEKNSFRGECIIKQSKNKECDRILEEIEKLEKDFKKIKWDQLVKVEPIAKPQKPRLISVTDPEKPTEPILMKVGLFNKKKALAENARLLDEYEKAIAAYEKLLKKCAADRKTNDERQRDYDRAIVKYESDIEQAKLEALEQARIKKQAAREELDQKIEELNKKFKLLNDQKDSAESNTYAVTTIAKEKAKAIKLLKKTDQAKLHALAVNVIFPKYQDIDAIATIYEYLLSKRCSSLEGHDGAYNLFESERRGDAITKIICKLEDLHFNEGVLHQLLKETVREADNISCKIKIAGESMIKIQTEAAEESNEETQKNIQDYFDYISETFKRIENDIKTSKSL